MRKIEDLTGLAFGDWLVCERGKDIIYHGTRCIMWKVVCPHIKKQVSGGSLRSGQSTGCSKCCGERQSQERKGKRFQNGNIVKAKGPDYTIREKQKQYNKQEGHCGLCDKDLPIDFRKSHWDHNHTTRKLRALVHAKCNNQIIALVENHPELIEKARAYLQSWK